MNDELIGIARHLTPNHCAIVTKPEMMRGFDMKAKPHGIDLLIAREFPTTRDYVQGLGRVGRYSEPSERFKLKTENPFSAVNKEEEIRRRGLISAKFFMKRPRHQNPTVTAEQQQQLSSLP